MEEREEEGASDVCSSPLHAVIGRVAGGSLTPRRSQNPA
jgi:hypothetical protein